MELISQPWPWYVAGPLIAFIMLGLLLTGKRFGLSSNLRSICAIMGAGNHCEFFDFNWRKQIWNLVFVLGLIIGGWIANTWMANPESIQLSDQTIKELTEFGISPNNTLIPSEIFSSDNLLTMRGLFFIVIGGFLVGFGSRYAGGCTSGHAISGLSDLQIPSLIAVVGFFIGGLIVTHLLLPIILTN